MLRPTVQPNCCSPYALRTVGDGHKHADAPHPLALLRARRERPRRCAAEQRHELAPFHSMTSSAIVGTSGGTRMPSALAVLRLRRNSNFVGPSTGSSVGLVPFKILST